MHSSVEKIARVLRADKDTILSIGREDILDEIVRQNENIIAEKLKFLGVADGKAREIYNALLERIQKDDAKIAASLGNPVCDSAGGCESLLDAAKKVMNKKKGFFVKENKARELLENIPPENILKGLGYKSVSEMLEKEDMIEIFSALRFVENSEWLNNVFFKQYEKLTPDDFEEREIKIMVLGGKWKDAAEKFLKKKYHNISHLKELGVIFILPAVMAIKGETLRTLALIFHYYHEIIFYSRLFKKAAKSDDFSQRVISFLRGDVLDTRFPEEFSGKRWMIIQKYLAKDDKNDWRLFEPHVNPEAIHWKKAENNISDLGSIVDSVDLSFWKELDWVGDYYFTEIGSEFLVSFNLVDTVMSLFRQKEMIKYLYHHQEALWNKIFSEAMGEEKMEEMIIQNWEKGYIDI